MTKRSRLPLAPERPTARAHALEPGARLDAGRFVIAVSGHESLAITFVKELLAAARGRAVGVVTSLSPHGGTPAVFRAAGACSGLAVDDSFVGGQARAASTDWLRELPRDAWVITAGRGACGLIAPTFSVGLGKRHETTVATTDLWLGQGSELVAGALVEALHTAQS